MDSRASGVGGIVCGCCGCECGGGGGGGGGDRFGNDSLVLLVIRNRREEAIVLNFDV